VTAGSGADVLRLHGQIEFFGGKADTAASAFLEALGLLEHSDRGAAVAAAADGVNALIRIRQPDRALETARRARSLAPEDGGEADAEATIALGYALCFAGRYGEAKPHLRRAAELFGAGETVPSPIQAGRLAAALGWLGRHEEAHAYLAETVRGARASGAVGLLPHLLASSAWQALHASRWNEAYADASESVELAEEVDQPVTAAQAFGVLTWVSALRGDDASRTRPRN
jgi:tetratricopeptide (TPR) repeat protein